MPNGQRPACVEEMVLALVFVLVWELEGDGRTAVIDFNKWGENACAFWVSNSDDNAIVQHNNVASARLCLADMLLLRFILFLLQSNYFNVRTLKRCMERSIDESDDELLLERNNL
mmetsp:Transcript_37351/g.45044  ORF Transcript_37351/g.45044 Transcript_37351/m.45044 type:complete len:115 (+) Transcript_37351:1707-2051(+)